MSVWRDLISKPKLSTYVGSVAEVGYSHYGPTFSVAGTLTAINSVILIHNICVEITTKKNKILHFMDWFAFRPKNYIMGNFSGLELTMAEKFTAVPNAPHEHNTLFIDTNRFAEMKSVLTAIKDTWEEALVTASRERKEVKPISLFEEFKTLKVITDAAERLKLMNYWVPGEYQAKIRVTTQNPKQVFDTKKSFILEEEDSEILFQNIPLIIGNICQQPHINYACIAPPRLTKN